MVPQFQILEESISTVAELAEVSIAFEYDRILDVTVVDKGLGGFVLSERQLLCAQIKDYDAIKGEGPASWSTRFDLAQWGFIVARAEGKRVGGAVIAFGDASIDMLEGRSDLAVLWDIRIARDFRGKGIGAALFQTAEAWAVENGRDCKKLKVETQNINVGACKFYARQGCTLGAINRFAYPAFPDEVQLLWYKDL